MKLFRQYHGLEIIANLRTVDGDTEELVTLEKRTPVRDYFTVLLNAEGEVIEWAACQSVVLPGVGFYSATFDTYLDHGLLDWKISAEPWRVPGVLELAWYLSLESGTDGEYATPDLVQAFTLDDASDLLTPSLDVYNYDSDPSGAAEDEPYVEMRFRWYPSKLAELL